MVKKETLLKKASRILTQIEKEKGIIQPQEVVNQSRPVGAPLHSHFQWDDDKAGEAYRRWQARLLIRDVSVKYSGTKVNAFYSVNVIIRGKSQRGYVSLVNVLSNKELKQQVLKNALRELGYWKTKYQNYKELLELVNYARLKKLEKKVNGKT